ncbi:phage tail spike protein [Clostridium perfringens]|uniref:Lysozyme n=1 Tax=Clostridium perfringens TaxID=1502 RepID=A0AAW4J1P0_CLOPF|nr:phage tail spike protein [Clostridium perfringens]MBO3342671.1 phage tail protein [Clostridium perfringens]MBO3345744.1 phage tail protein [Clostridium perfringens]MBO3348816.1 phage tail protein [Clostridium perfringens]MBO3352065.1 phage tail protein [Clostridium perfringens]MBO3354717.1 phage tail protein [Clostridium perfringens]
MSIEYYKGNNTNYEFDGDVTLVPNKAIFDITMNGICEIEINHPYDKEGRWKIINGNGVIKAPTPYSKGQLFVIYSIDKNMLTTGLKIKARHIFFDLYYSTTEDIRAVNCNCQRALDILFNGTKFTGHSNIKKINTCYFVKQNRIEAINGSNKDNTIINRWGGEIFLDNFNVYINERIGEDKGLEILYGTNMLDLGLKENRKDIVTRIKPVAFNGIRLPELFIDSPLISKYRIVYEKYIEFSNLKFKGDLQNESEDTEDGSIIFETKEELYNALREECKKLFENGIDKPKITGNVKVAALSNTEKYKFVKDLVNINLGDTLTAKHLDLDIDIKVRCVGYKWDILKEKYIDVTIGDVVKNYFQNQSDTTQKVNSILNENGTVKSSELEGAINALKAPLLAQKSRAKKSDVVAWIQEVLDPNDPDYGCLQGGTKGILLSDERLDDNSDWNFKTAVTPKGIIADWIIGKLRTVLIENMDASFQMDLNKPGGMLFKNNGKDAIKIERNMVQLFNWKKNGDYIGALMSLIQGDDGNKPSIGLANTLSSALTIGYEEKDSNKVPSYLEFDKYNILKDKNNKPVRVYEDIDFKNRNLYSAVLSSLNDKCYIYNNDEKTVIKHEDVTIKLEKGKITLDGDVVLNGVIKNTSGNLVLDPNAPQGGGVDGSDSLRNSVVNSARKLIGKPYVWGGNYPPLGSDAGTDCSGLMQWAYNDNGIKISRTTYTQIKEGIEVSEAELKPGDLIFLRFSSPGVPEHVFMYSGKTGDGKHMCVEAPRTGLNIREIEFTWGSNYRARRIIKDTPGGNVNGTAGTKASKNIIYYVKGIEGYAPYHYYDSVGVKTLGYGMTGNELNGVSVPLSETSATHYLVNNFNRDYYIPVLNIVKSKGVSNPLQREIDAFASFAYNCGVEGFRNSQLLKRYVNGERGESIHNEFMKWIHAGSSVSNGLIRRREEEWKIFSGSSSPVGGYNTAPSISYINKAGLPTSKLVTENGGYGASPY